MRRSLLAFAIVMLPVTSVLATPADPPKFERIVIDNDFPGAYQVEVADVNGDKKPDVIVVGGGTCAWYENPTWKKRIVTTPKQTPGIISSATADLDGDGKAEIAIAYEFAMNEPKKGKLLLAAQGKTVEDPWTLKPVDDIGSIHRIRWNEEKRPAGLIVAPLFGADARPPTYDQDAAKILLFEIDGSPDPKAWKRRAIGERPVLHAIEFVVGGGGHAIPFLFTADNLGVGLVAIGDRTFSTLVPGAAGPKPKRGASEFHLGRSGKGDWAFLATIEPWHGTEVAVYDLRREKKDNSWPPKFGPRVILDDTLDEGHALWTADIDGDGDDEVFAGHRGKDHRVSMYRFDGKAWNKTVLDRDIAAQDMRGGDLDGDGKPDVVTVGGSTHNVVWYRFK